MLKVLSQDVAKLYESLDWTRQNYPPPKLKGIDMYGESRPFHDIGGDKITWEGFNERHDLDLRAQIAKSERDERFRALLEFRKLRKNLEERAVPDVNANLPMIERQLAEDYQSARKLHRNIMMNYDRAGILLIDVMGHYDLSGAHMKGTLHQLFLFGAQYELEKNGELTTTLFENIDMRMTLTDAWNLYSTMLYGEISSKGTFRFISAGHPGPMVFSSEYDKFVETPSPKNSAPIGFPDIPERFIDRKRYAQKFEKTRPPYEINSVKLMAPGDIILLFTDGLTDERTNSAGESFYPSYLERVVSKHKYGTAKEIFDGVMDAANSFCKPNDDTTLVVIKKI